MTLAVLNIDWQTLADAIALGAIYALMAVGIGLVFGVLRLVNFAYGQLVMAGAFALALASQWGWPVWAGIVLCFASVLVLSMLMDRLVFRPLRGHSPAVMLVATFAVAFLLQSVALLWFGPLGKIASSLSSLNQPVTISGVDIRKITIVAVVVAVVCLVALSLLLERTTIGLHMRASSMDFQTARMLGVRANRVIGVAVLLSGALAAVVAVMLTIRSTGAGGSPPRSARRRSGAPPGTSAIAAARDVLGASAAQRHARRAGSRRPSTGAMPMIACSVDDLPAPFAPISPTTRPVVTSNDRSRTAWDTAVDERRARRAWSVAAHFFAHRRSRRDTRRQRRGSRGSHPALLRPGSFPG